MPSTDTTLRELISRLFLWRVGIPWYLAALLPAPLASAAVLFALSLTSPIFTAPDKTAILLAGITAGLTTVLEEIGWTGFATPRLRRRYSPVATGLIVGVLWGAWHLLIAVWASSGLAGGASLTGFVAGFLAFYFIALPAYRVLMVWLYDQTASLLLAMLIHAVLSASTLILQPASARGQFMWNILLGLALRFVVAAVAKAKPDELSRRPVQVAAGQVS